MAVTKTAETSEKLMKPIGLVVTIYDGTETKGAPKGKTYLVQEGERDSASIAQDDNETSDLENEFSDTPYYTATTLGKYQFAVNLPDTQKDVLVDMLGFKVATSGKIYAPTSYTDKFVQTATVYKSIDKTSGNEKYVAFVIPRMQVNSKFTAESLNSKVAGVALNGTAKDWEVEDGVRTPFYIDPNYTMPE